MRARVLGGLLSEKIIGAGSIVDAGANDGSEACFFAERQPERSIRALEPLQQNVDFMFAKYAPLFRNLLIERKALGRRLGWLDTAPFARAKPGLRSQVSNTGILARETAPPRNATRIVELDRLFETAWRGERLGFAHFDVEGCELDVLHGAVQTIARDRPVFTVEAFVHNHANATLALLVA